MNESSIRLIAESLVKQNEMLERLTNSIYEQNKILIKMSNNINYFAAAVETETGHPFIRVFAGIEKN